MLNSKKTFRLCNPEYHFFKIYFELHNPEVISKSRLAFGLCNLECIFF